MAVLSITERQKLLSNSRYSKSSSKRNTLPTGKSASTNARASTDKPSNSNSNRKMSLAEYKKEVAALELSEDSIYAREVKRLDANPVIKNKMLEHYEQCLYFKWLLNNHPQICDVAASVPNGSKRVGMDGYSLSAEGLNKGWPDVQIMYPANNKFGLFIEFKRQPCGYSCRSSAQAAPKERQKTIIRKLNTMGYLATFAFGCAEAIKITEQYLLNGTLPTDLFFDNNCHQLSATNDTQA
ncbi:hypothetical protein [Photobacterium toruni]|uniref:hypothetical protein n=1 Tax=Photobacterium toruni TaxID=1935446 RepID=UPI0021100946|nr:hypothetical protein [Photobacterium toruni]